MDFKNINELYNRLLPALVTRKFELRSLNINMSEKDIFNSLINLKWKMSHNLTLDEMVNDILNYKDDGFCE